MTEVNNPAYLESRSLPENSQYIECRKMLLISCGVQAERPFRRDLNRNVDKRLRALWRKNANGQRGPNALVSSDER